MERRSSVFSTLTYSRDKNSRDCWLDINNSTNRYIQRVRRKINHCEYLKVYEIHKDKFPHVHVLFLFRDFSYPFNGDRWLPTDVFKKLKSSWTQGLSDHQSPMVRSDYGALNYILKYVSKNSSSSHLWTQLLGLQTDVRPPNTNELGYPVRSSQYASYKILLIPDSQTLTYSTLKEKKIKLISWSRSFVEYYLKSNNS